MASVPQEKKEEVMIEVRGKSVQQQRTKVSQAFKKTSVINENFKTEQPNPFLRAMNRVDLMSGMSKYRNGKRSSMDNSN